MLSLLIYILILLIVFSVIFYIIRLLPLEPPFGAVAQAVVGFRQRPASDAKERREFSVAATAEALRDVAGRRGCRVADLIAESEIP